VSFKAKIYKFFCSAQKGIYHRGTKHTEIFFALLKRDFFASDCTDFSRFFRLFKLTQNLFRFAQKGEFTTEAHRDIFRFAQKGFFCLRLHGF
jgi:hypothetical protein